MFGASHLDGRVAEESYVAGFDRAEHMYKGARIPRSGDLEDLLEDVWHAWGDFAAAIGAVGKIKGLAGNYRSENVDRPCNSGFAQWQIVLRN